MNWKYDKTKKAFYDIQKSCSSPDNDNATVLICDEWLNNPSAFEEWLVENGYLDDGAALKRKDKNKPFSPENCLVLNRLITVNEITQSLSEWSEQFGYNKYYFYQYFSKYGKEKTIKKIQFCLNNGYTPAKHQHGKVITCNGVSKSFDKWAAELDVSGTHLRSIYKLNGEKALQDYISARLKKNPEERKRKINLITIDGRTQSAYKWAKEIDCPPNYISVIFNEKGIDAAVEFIKRRRAKEKGSFHKKYVVTVNNETKPISEWAKEIGCSYSILLRKIVEKGEEETVKYIKHYLEFGCAPTPKYYNPRAYMVTINEETHNLKQWAEIINVSQPYLSQTHKTYGKEYLINIIKERLENPQEFKKRNNYNCSPITVNGITKSASAWSKELGYSHVYIGNIRRNYGIEAAVKQIETCLKTGQKQPFFSDKIHIIEIDGVHKSLYKWSLHFNHGPCYFATLKRKKGLDAVIEKIKESLNDGKEHTVRAVNKNQDNT